METGEIIGIIAGVVIGTSIIGYMSYTMFKVLVGVFKKVQKNQADSSDQFTKIDQAQPLPNELDDVVQRLEVERIRVKAKTKGLFKRAFLRAWFVIAGIPVILVLILSDEKLIPSIGFSVMGAALSAIGAGIYTLVKKGNNRTDFVSKLKKELVSKIVTIVNPELSFFDEGIDREEFIRADMFGGRTIESQDTIKGNIDGHPITITELTNVTHRKSTASNSNGSTYTYFNGIFVHLKLTGINLASILKIVPVIAVDNNQILMSRSGASTRRYFNRLKVDMEDKIALDPSSKKGNYEFFCKSPEVVQSFIKPGNLKVLDFIFEKYESEKKSLFEGIPFLQNLKQRSGIYISIIEDDFYLMLDWNKDMFEPDAFLNRNLVESGIAKNIHSDILFINQIVKEVGLLSKVSM